MSERTAVLAAIASSAFFQRIEPLISRSSLKVTRVQSGAQAMTLARETAYQLVLVQHPLPDMGFREFFSAVRAGDSASVESALLILTRDDRLEPVAGYLDGEQTQACCIDAAPEQLQLALSELLGIAVRASARLGVELNAQLDGREVSRFCQTVNVSESGLLLRFKGSLPVGSELSLAIHLPDESEPIQAVGRVVRRTDPNKEALDGIAVRLIEIPATGRRRLAEFIDQSEEADD